MTSPAVHVMHILREPRAVVPSERRISHLGSVDKAFAPPGALTGASLLRWQGANLSVAVGPRLFRIQCAEVSHEQSASYPTFAMRWLTERLELACNAGPLNDNYLKLGNSHVAVENPRRLTNGPRQLVVDDRCRTELRGRQRVLAELGAAPTLALSRGQ